MTPEVGRRIFMGTVAAGVPLLAGWTTGAFAKGPAAQGTPAAHADHTSADPVDPVVDHLLRQIGRAHNALRRRPKGEDARSLAANLRTFAVYARQHDVDVNLRRALREQVTRQGRNGLLYAEPDLARRRRELQKYGFDADDRAFASLPGSRLEPSHADRDAALDALLATGVTPAIERIAAVAERAAQEIDRLGTVVTVAHGDPIYMQAYCAELWRQYGQAQMLASILCTTALYMPYAAAACIAAQGGATALASVYFVMCAHHN